MSKHTPGPWKAIDGPEPNSIAVVGRFFVGWDPDSWTHDFWVHGGQWKPGHEVGEARAKANAHLIAAAPDLLAACRAALGAFEHNHAIHWNDLALAIAKAEGR